MQSNNPTNTKSYQNTTIKISDCRSMSRHYSLLHSSSDLGTNSISAFFDNLGNHFSMSGIIMASSNSMKWSFSNIGAVLRTSFANSSIDLVLRKDNPKICPFIMFTALRCLNKRSWIDFGSHKASTFRRSTASVAVNWKLDNKEALSAVSLDRKK